jgi:hypothetical protein
MQLIRRSRRGQSTAEYAVLFAIVIGAAIAMQQYVKSRLQGAMADQSNKFQTAAEGAAPFEPARTVDTTSGQTAKMDMTSARAGTAKLDSESLSTSTVTK